MVEQGTTAEPPAGTRLANASVEFGWHAAGGFDLVDCQSGRPLVSGATAAAQLTDGEWLGFAGDGAHSERTFADAGGVGRELTLQSEPVNGLTLTLKVRLYDDRPGCLLQLTCRNGGGPVRLRRLAPLRVDGGRNGGIGLPKTVGSRVPFPTAAVWTNGYQSWSAAAAYRLDERDTDSLIPFIKVMQSNQTTRKRRRAPEYYGEWLAAIVDRSDGQALSFGFATMADQLAQVAISAGRHWRVEASCDLDDVLLTAGAEMASEWLLIDSAAALEPVLERYAELSGRLAGARRPTTVPASWCSWYYYSTRVNEGDIIENLAALSSRRTELPVEYIQLDDGYQAAIGDWLDANEKFPHGLKWLVDRIHAAGFKAGLWLAPFTVLANSRLFREHPDWLLRDADGKLAYGGYNLSWGGRLYGLDTSHPEVQAWLRRVFTAVTAEWGFDHVKLDFLYCAALPGRRHDQTWTRAQSLRRGLQVIRETVGERFILGCGCPLGPAVGIVDGMRIGPDAAPDWHGRPLPWEWGIPSARNALRNALNRSFMHDRWWLNDPDCLIVRQKDSHLSEDEVRTLAAAIALSGGMPGLSDRVSALSPDRLRLLSQTLPASGRPARAIDLGLVTTPELYALPVETAWGGWTVAGLFNWGERPLSRRLPLTTLGLAPDRDYHIFDFWRGYLGQTRGTLNIDGVPPHGCRLLRLTPVSDQPTVVGTTLHLTQGLTDIAAVTLTVNGLAVTLNRHPAGEITCWLPDSSGARQPNGRLVTARIAAGGPASVMIRANPTSS